MRNPEQYAIYDARVAVALNALQVAKALPQPTFFPVLSSQNKQIRAANPKLKAHARQASWRTLDDATFYATYLDLLNAAADACPLAERPALHSLEMLLFAKAEELLDQAGFGPNGGN